ncbi:triphosphoribosyl-dephospho-CoA synthase [Methanohalophilus levihalophilus]|uniref:triphosphoribosyl-dephospho-CoA synthase n=1 Tax=Methanohalophilus levihalophilus TaxID=1431282 RepID=UPI001AE8E150|nr:triphosphoribosyl-dephospho-CoA synthase [Methanohalophilus levihalophilus]MBP2029328.1 triphosphoribosyl-dephospho-CoA synthase [Methanohalophilus levihalophilus]
MEIALPQGQENVASYIARCCQLAMALEVSATPKPGNIDRTHDFDDTRYEHFIASAISAYPVMHDAAFSRYSVGKLLDMAVAESNRWQRGGNTHFGAFLLLIPLAMSAGKLLSEKGSVEAEEVFSKAYEIVQAADTDDAVDFYRCFQSAGVKVQDVGDLDLQDSGAIEDIQKKGVNLYQLMEISSSYDLIAREWTNGFPETDAAAIRISELLESGLGINYAIVQTFLELLAARPDTFIQTKSGKEVAESVSKSASEIVSEIHKSGIVKNLPLIEDFDESLLENRNNPGSTADIIIASLFIVLLGGLRF